VTRPLVVKFGGDALALPEGIAEAARLVGRRLTDGPVVAVASARRGITDHLLGLVEQVRENTEAEGLDNRGTGAAADRAVAAGELVSASLLALALSRRGIRAEVLDAREAGLRSDGAWSRAQLTRVTPTRVSRLLRRGITPVVTGFQGWHRGRTTTLGRGGSDTTAVALAIALSARECELVKHHGGIFTTDPKIVPEARLLARVSHRFLTELAGAGAKVIAYRAAVLAEQAALPLRFSSVHDDNTSEVRAGGGAPNSAGIALRAGGYRFTGQSISRISQGQQQDFLARAAVQGVPAELEVSDLAAGSRIDLVVGPDELEVGLGLARSMLPGREDLALLATGVTTVTVLAQPQQVNRIELAARSSGTHILRTVIDSHRIAILVSDAEAHLLARTLHTALFAYGAGETLESANIPETSKRFYVGHR
jgi:aspartate kinase